MENTCAHCSRVNPAGAIYCYFDGSALNGHVSGAPQNIGAQTFPTPFVFPSGKSCRSFDQLATACQQDWAGAVELLRSGVLERFFGGLGRADLAQAARAAAGFPDAERGLDQLLDRFPSQVLQPPQLAVEPTEINLGSLKADTDHHLDLVLTNHGMRLLYGSVVSNTPWLSLGDGQGGQKLFQTSTETTVRITVRSRYLHAGNKPLEGRLTVESNGGRQLVTVKATVPARPFPDGVLEGALTPRQLAEKAKAAPKEAARSFENGTVARWYQLNGWTYPVQGPAASGLGAVQQFFEALGLAKPPRVELSETAFDLHGQPGESMRRYLQVKTAEKRPVFASAASDQAWLTVGPIQLIGPVATIPLEVTQVPAEPGQVLQARVCVTANGGQRFVVPVSLAVTDAGLIRAIPVAAVTHAPVDTAVEAAPAGHKSRPIQVVAGVPVRKHAPNDDKAPENASTQKYLLLAGLLLLLLLGGGGVLILLLSGTGGPTKVEIAVKDEPAEEKQVHKVGGLAFEATVKDEPEERHGPGTIPVQVAIKDEPEEHTRPIGPQPVKVTFGKDEDEEGAGMAGGGIDPDLRIAYAYGPNQTFGITAIKDQAGQFLNKQLTYAPNGQTNRTMIRVNSIEAPYGAPTGQWLLAGQFKDDPARPSKARSISVLQIGSVRGKPANLRISQQLEIVPSKQPVSIVPGVRKRLLDTVLIRYLLENADKKAYLVGMRVQVDTLIGGNDGVPFTVPGYAGLVGAFADFRAPKKIPAFVQALEKPDLRNPGTVAHMTLKVGGGIEPPDRVSLTCWRADQGRYYVPIAPLAGDSCVVLYWPEKLLKAGEKRIVGFAYGLGAVDAGEGAGSLGITLGGSFEPGQVFTVTAYVNNPVPRQTVTLEVPQGLEIQDKATVAVPRPEGNPPTSIVTWNTKVLQTGEFKIRVRSSTGVSQSKTISIVRPDGPSGKLQVVLDGKVEPGAVFTVTTRVSGVTPKQQLQLQLPKGLERVEGEEMQPVPQPAAKDGESAVVWKVKMQAREPGKYPLRVVSNTGIAQTKTLTIERGDASAGRFELTLSNVQPGRPFVVSALVPRPLPNQTLTLQLDPRMTLVNGASVQKVPSFGPQGGRVNWNVVVQQPGKYTLRVESSHGLALKKTIGLERADENAGKFVLDFSGTIAPGKEFKVIGKVTNPLAGQKLTLNLPNQLQLVEGLAQQDVPTFAPGVQGTSTVQWTVRVLEAGTLRVRVESTTGYARSKTITITQVQDNAAIFGK